MKKILCATGLSVLMSLALLASVTCFLKGEKVDGQLKICFYDCLGDEAATTIKSVQLCPLTIKR